MYGIKKVGLREGDNDGDKNPIFSVEMKAAGMAWHRMAPIWRATRGTGPATVLTHC